MLLCTRYLLCNAWLICCIRTRNILFWFNVSAGYCHGPYVTTSGFKLHLQNRPLTKSTVSMLPTICIKRKEKSETALSGQSCAPFRSKGMTLWKSWFRLLSLLSRGFVKAQFIMERLNRASMLWPQIQTHSFQHSKTSKPGLTSPGYAVYIHT